MTRKKKTAKKAAPVQNPFSDYTRAYVRKSMESTYTKGEAVEVHFGLYKPEERPCDMVVYWNEDLQPPAPQLRVYDDSWKALAWIPDVLQAMAKVDNKAVDEERFVLLLMACGFEDRTKYADGQKPVYITIRTGARSVFDEWEMKEYGSWEDSKYAKDHVVSILKRFKENSTVTLTEKEADTLLVSGEYQGWSWEPDEIDGGLATIMGIRAYVKKIKKALAEAKGETHEE